MSSSGLTGGSSLEGEEAVRKFAFLTLIAVVALGFWATPVQAKGRKYMEVGIINAGDAGRFELSFYRTSKDGKKVKKHPDHQVETDIARLGTHTWPQAIQGRYYLVQYSGVDKAGKFGGSVRISANGELSNYAEIAEWTLTEDPQVTIARLEGIIAGQEARIEEFQTMINALQGQIQNLLQQLGSPPPWPTITKNESFVDPAYIPGTAMARVASFTVKPGNTEGFLNNRWRIQVGEGLDTQNLQIRVDGVQFGTTIATVPEAGTIVDVNSSTPWKVAKGGVVIVDIFEDILTTTPEGRHIAPIKLVGWSAVGEISGSALSFPGGEAISGQDVLIVGGPTLTVSTSSNEPPAQYAVMGTSDVVGFSMRLTASLGDIRITDIPVRVKIEGNTASYNSTLKNFELAHGDQSRLAGPSSMIQSSATSGTIDLVLTTPLVVAEGTSKEVYVPFDIATFADGAVSGAKYTFTVLAEEITAVAAGNPATTVNLVGKAQSNATTVYRSVPKISTSPLGASSSRARVSIDDWATVNLGGGVTFESITYQVAGGAVKDGTPAFTVDQLDPNTGNLALGSSKQQTATPGAGNTCSVTFNVNYTTSEGGMSPTTLRARSSNFANSSGGDSLSVSIVDVRWSDGTSTNIPLDPSFLPFRVITVLYE